MTLDINCWINEYIDCEECALNQTCWKRFDKASDEWYNEHVKGYYENHN